MLSRVDDLAPGLLIAVPQMEDPNFSRSVVLLIEHSDAGAMGIVFNRPSEVPLSEIGEEQGLRVHPQAGRAFIGGPVSPERGFLLHRRADVPDSIKVHDGLFLSVSTERIFDTPAEKVWDAAIRDLGIDPAFLVPSGGPQ